MFEGIGIYKWQFEMYLSFQIWEFAAFSFPKLNIFGFLNDLFCSLMFSMPKDQLRYTVLGVFWRQVLSFHFLRTE